MSKADGRRLATAILRGGWTFVRTYLMRAGFLDGREGFMVAVYAAENTFHKYLKLDAAPAAAGKPGIARPPCKRAATIAS